jgi:hypothetical protein
MCSGGIAARNAFAVADKIAGEAVKGGSLIP